MDNAQVASRLRDELGWYAWAGDIAHGRRSQARLADVLNGGIARKEDWLSRHTFQADTEGEGRHHAMRTWCERARSLIAEMQEEGT